MHGFSVGGERVLHVVDRNSSRLQDNHHFRSESLAGGRFESIFHRVVKLLHYEGLISLYVQLIDGTKIE